MIVAAVRTAWIRDLPVCFPGRQCVDEPPLEADLINATSALTPIAPAIAIGCFALLGAALVLTGLGLRLQWRGGGVRPWLVVLVTTVLFIGLVVSTAAGARADTIAAIYAGIVTGGEYGQPRVTPPASVIGSWPWILVAADGMLLLGLVGIAAMIVAFAIRRRRRVGS